MRHIALWAILAGLFIGIGSPALLNAEEANGIPVGSVAPPLQGSAWITADGKAPEMKGKVVLIDFWFEKCGPCVAAMPQVMALNKKYAERGLVVVGASVDPAPAVKAFKLKKGIEYAMLAETKTDPFQQELFPYIFLIGKNGKIIWKGDLDVKEVSEKIEAALAEK